MKKTMILGMFMAQLRLATQSGLKGKDDCIDTISMLGYLKPWKPSMSTPTTPDEIDIWDEQHRVQETSPLSSYIV